MQSLAILVASVHGQVEAWLAGPFAVAAYVVARGPGEFRGSEPLLDRPDRMVRSLLTRDAAGVTNRAVLRRDADGAGALRRRAGR